MIVLDKMWCQWCELAGHGAFAIRKQREGRNGARLVESQDSTPAPLLRFHFLKVPQLSKKVSTTDQLLTKD